MKTYFETKKENGWEVKPNEVDFTLKSADEYYAMTYDEMKDFSEQEWDYVNFLLEETEKPEWLNNKKVADSLRRNENARLEEQHYNRRLEEQRKYRTGLY